MAISLSELTGASTSGNVLNEVNSYADFLDSVPRLVNKADPSGDTDAVQTTATNQPKALPLIDGEGYLYLSGVSGNDALAENPILPSTGDFDLTIDFVWKNKGSDQDLFGQYNAGYTGRFFIYITTAGELKTFWNGGSDHQGGASGSIIEGRRHVARFNRTGNTFAVYLDGASYYSYTVGSSVPILAVESTIGSGGATRATQIFKGAIFSVTEGSNFECDFNSPRIPHGSREFTCETGQVVTVNTSGNDPATIIKKSVLRFDGVNGGLNGFFQNTISDGYMFAAFSVLGNGGETSARVFGINSTGDADYQNTGSILSAIKGLNLSRYAAGVAWETLHVGMSDDDNGDILHEIKIQSNYQISRVNNADEATRTTDISDVNAEEFNIGDGSPSSTTSNAAIDLEYLALFPASLSDSQADRVRNFINNRNKVFSLIDSQGYYFFNGAATDDGQVFTGSGSWNGRIVGSDNGDSDFYANENTTSENRPTTDGYKVTFADNSDKLDIPQVTLAVGDTHAWQVVGTSLGTFAYKVTVSGQTELNLLGHLGHANYRKAGDLYGIILLPENATNRDIEEARKLLIDRGAADASTIISAGAAWFRRYDIIEFKNAEFPDAVSLGFAFEEATNLRTINTVNAPLSTNFSSAWRNCSSLTQFPQDAKLGTEATNVNFSNAWRESGLTSFSTPLPTALTVYAAWYDIPELTDFNVKSLPLVTDIRFAWYNNRFTSFNTKLPNVRSISGAWINCFSLTDFSADVFANWNPSALYNGMFNQTWTGCTSLTAQSVENILVPIANSGKWATTNGLEGGSGIGDATIDIDYDVSTGSLTAATLSAIETLNGRGWSVNINGEIIVPNILQLQPAAAYSLRSFDADADPNVVNVRRSSDSALSDFTASEVSDGTLTDWVNTDVDLVTPTLNNGGFEDGLTGWSSSTAIVDTSVAYSGSNSARLDIVSGGYQEIARQNILEIGKEYKVTFWAKVSDSSKDTRVDFGSGNLNAVSFNSTNWEYKEVTGVASGSTSFRFARSSSGDYSVNFDNVTITQLTADGHVTTWYDQGGTNHASQTTASSQPKIVDGGVLVTEGGKAALDFDRVDDVFNMPAGMISSLSDIFVSAVFTGSDGSNDYGVVLGEPTERIYVPYVTSNILYIGYSDSAVKLSDGAYSDGLQLVTLSVDDTTASGFRNSSAFSIQPTASASSSPPVITTRGDRIGSFGSAVFTSMNFSEVIIFNTDQVANRAGIENNINDHFNIYS